MHGPDLQKIKDLIARHGLDTPVTLGCFDNAPSSSGAAGGSGSHPSSASSGVVEAEAPPAKRAKTEPASEAGLAEKPFDQRPLRFKSDDLTEVPLPNGLVMLFFRRRTTCCYITPTLPRHSSSRAAQYFVASRRGTGSRKPATRRRTP